jgi:hypothetical protein
MYTFGNLDFDIVAWRHNLTAGDASDVIVTLQRDIETFGKKQTKALKGSFKE